MRDGAAQGCQFRDPFWVGGDSSGAPVAMELRTVRVPEIVCRLGEYRPRFPGRFARGYQHSEGRSYQYQNATLAGVSSPGRQLSRVV
jgi:hypothetical protein